MLEHSKHKWSEFIIDLLALSLTAKDQAEPMSWLCNFTCLYNDYLFNRIDIDRSSHTSFDRFLYSKISPSVDWRRCNSYLDLRTKKEWCIAWKRIMLNSNIDINFMEFSKKLKSFSNHKQRSELYLKDVETMMHWLTSKIESKKCSSKEAGTKVLPYNPWQLRRETSHTFDVAMCYATTLVTALFTWSDCLKNLGKP